MTEIELKELISEALCTSTDHAAYLVGRTLAELYPDRYVLFGRNHEFRITEFARQEKCHLIAESAVFDSASTAWRGPSKPLTVWPENALFKVLWGVELIDVLYITWHEGLHRTRHHWVIAESCEIARNFLSAVCESWVETREEVLVFEDGCWEKNEELFESIQQADLNKVILGGNMKSEILQDVTEFFAARDTYAEYGVPWKRGVLFIGPPGNGKTGMVKGLLKELKQRCLYIKSFDSSGSSDQENIREVFTMARRVAPCIVVLEDIDSLIKAKTRSFFLNEMDGFASNSGFMMIATTNHPERLDPAILNRPSRFDRKFFFELPGVDQRAGYLRVWNEPLKAEMRLSAEGLCAVAALTEGFSFAFLKELCMSSITEWLSAKGARSLDQIAGARARVLSKEIVTVAGQPSGVIKGNRDYDQQAAGAGNGSEPRADAATSSG
ncbi:MAG TPA: ATP-binding protein [Blastocatellia bacterium]|nr:ATP-binding protein [Blastocatellia bacterium]